MWLFQASKSILAYNLMTLACTIILLQLMKILPSQDDPDDKTATIETRFHTNSFQKTSVIDLKFREIDIYYLHHMKVVLAEV